MMNIMVISASPEWKEMAHAEREVVTAVGIDSLKQSEYDPDIHSQDVQVATQQTPDNGHADSSQAKNHDFDGGRVLGSKPKRRRVLMVDLVDIFVQRTPMQCSVSPVVPGVLHDKEDGNLIGHGQERRERNISAQPDKLRHWMEEPRYMSDRTIAT